MSFENYQLAWRTTSTNAPLTAEVESFVHNMMKTERRGRIVRAVCALNAAAAMLLTIFVLLFRRPLASNELLPVIGLQLTVTLGLAIIIRRGRARRRALESGGLTVREAARTGLAHVTSEIRDLRFLAKLLCVIVPLLGFSIAGLISSGKMDLQEALSFGLLAAAIISVNLILRWRKYRRTLAPQRARLQQILTSLEVES